MASLNFNFKLNDSVSLGKLYNDVIESSGITAGGVQNSDSLSSDIGTANEYGGNSSSQVETMDFYNSVSDTSKANIDNSYSTASLGDNVTSVSNNEGVNANNFSSDSVNVNSDSLENPSVNKSDSNNISMSSGSRSGGNSSSFTSGSNVNSMQNNGQNISNGVNNGGINSNSNMSSNGQSFNNSSVNVNSNSSFGNFGSDSFSNNSSDSSVNTTSNNINSNSSFDNNGVNVVDRSNIVSGNSNEVGIENFNIGNDEGFIQNLSQLGLEIKDIYRILNGEISIEDLFREIENDFNRSRMIKVMESQYLSNTELGITSLSDLKKLIENLRNDLSELQEERRKIEITLKFANILGRVQQGESLDNVLNSEMIMWEYTDDNGNVCYKYEDPYSNNSADRFYRGITFEEMFPNSEELERLRSVLSDGSRFEGTDEQIEYVSDFYKRYSESEKLLEDINNKIEAKIEELEYCKNLYESINYEINYYMNNVDKYIRRSNFADNNGFNENCLDIIEGIREEYKGISIKDYSNDIPEVFVTDKKDIVDILSCVINGEVETVYGGYLVVGDCWISITSDDDMIYNFREWASLLKNEEIEVFNYLYNKGDYDDKDNYINGTNAAYQYLLSISDELDRRCVAEKTLRDQEYAKEHPVLASVASIIVTPFEGLSAACYSFNALIQDEKIRRTHTYSMGDVYRSSVAQDIAVNYGEGWSFVYSTGMSMADSVSLIGASVLTGGVGVPVLSATIMGSRSYVSTLNEALERGLSDGKAVLLATSSAIVETAMESYSVGHLLNLEGKLGDTVLGLTDKIAGNIENKTVANLVTKAFYIGASALSQGIAEGEEELCTEIVNYVADRFISENLSNYTTSINKYLEYGYTEDEANIATMWDFSNQAMMAFLGGFVSGICFGSFSGISTTYEVSNDIAHDIYKEYSGLSRAEQFAAVLQLREEMINNPDGDLAKKIAERQVEYEYNEAIKKDLENMSKLYGTLKGIEKTEGYKAYLGGDTSVTVDVKTGIEYASVESQLGLLGDYFNVISNTLDTNVNTIVNGFASNVEVDNEINNKINTVLDNMVKALGEAKARRVLVMYGANGNINHIPAEFREAVQSLNIGKTEINDYFDTGKMNIGSQFFAESGDSSFETKTSSDIKVSNGITKDLISWYISSIDSDRSLLNFIKKVFIDSSNIDLSHSDFDSISSLRTYVFDLLLEKNLLSGIDNNYIFAMADDPVIFSRLIECGRIGSLITINFDKVNLREMLLQKFSKLDYTELNKMFNLPDVKQYILSLSADKFASNIDTFEKLNMKQWLQLDTFCERILNFSSEEFFDFLNSKINYSTVDVLFNSKNFQGYLKILEKIDNEFYSEENALNNPYYATFISKILSPFGDTEIAKLSKKIESRADGIFTLYNNRLVENSDIKMVNSYSGAVIENLDSNSIYNITYEYNGEIFEKEELVGYSGKIYIKQVFKDANMIKAMYDGQFRILSIEKNEAKSNLILKESDGLKKGLNKIVLKVNGIEQALLINSRFTNFDLNRMFKDITSSQILSIESVPSYNAFSSSVYEIFKVLYDVDGETREVYITSRKANSSQEVGGVIDIDSYFVENNIVDASNIRIERFNADSVDVDAFNINKYSASLDIYKDNKYGGNQSDVEDIIAKRINGYQLSYIEEAKAETMIKLIKKYYPDITDMEMISLSTAYASSGCGYMAIANAFCTYIGSMENGNQIFKERFGYDLYVEEGDSKNYNLEALALDIFCYNWGILNEMTIENVVNADNLGLGSMTYNSVINSFFTEKGIRTKVVVDDDFSNDMSFVKKNLISSILNSSKNQFRILRAGNFDLELLGRDNQLASSDKALAGSSTEGKIVDRIGGHAMLITSLSKDLDLIVSSWSKKFKFLSDSLISNSAEKYTYSSILTLEFMLEGSEEAQSLKQVNDYDYVLDDQHIESQIFRREQSSKKNDAVRELWDGITAMDAKYNQKGLALNVIYEYLNGRASINNISSAGGLRQVVANIGNRDFNLLVESYNEIVNRVQKNEEIIRNVRDPINNYQTLDRIVSAYYNPNSTNLSVYKRMVTAIMGRNSRTLPSYRSVVKFVNEFINSGKYTVYSQGNYFNHIWSKGYNIDADSIRYRLYLNTDSTSTLSFAHLFASECEKNQIPFYLKTGLYSVDNNGNVFCADSTLTRDESVVIYCEEKYFSQYVEICKKIINDHHELNFYEAPMLTGKITDQIGFGMEGENHNISYNSARSSLIESAIFKLEQEFVNKYGEPVLNDQTRFFDINKVKNNGLYQEFLNYLYWIIKEYSTNYGIAEGNFSFGS